MEILKVENLSKIYGKGETQVVALDDISFSIQKGEFVSIIGPSGSGKSTMLHILGGVDRPTKGKVYINNQDIYSLNNNELAIFRRRNIGLIYQFYNLIPILNVEENISLPVSLDHRPIDEKKLEQIIKNLGLEKRTKHLPNQLSGGQQQRVSIGRSLITEPAIILADEPTGNLDSKNSKEILDLLKFSNKEYNQTLIMITHDQKLAKEAQRIITIKDGKIASDEIN
ncbi:MAG: ABC transporter ATP-binding protein [Clostridia bacterium]|nr:ABC transporter ATP-binding protein [Clostridia bacterium]